MKSDDYDERDPDRHLKRINAVMGVSSKIKKLANEKRQNATKKTLEEKNKEIEKDAKGERSQRKARLGSGQIYILDMLSLYMGIDQDILIETALDSEANIRLLESIFEAGGRSAILVQYKLAPYPGLASGRYNKENKGKTIMPVFSEATNQDHSGKAAVVYRTSNTEKIDPLNAADEIYVSTIPEGESILKSVHDHLDLVFRPSLQNFDGYENCNETQKYNFLYEVDHFMSFLKQTNDDIENTIINFEVDHKLFKGFLLVPHQIEASSKNPEKVALVEKAFAIWMKKIENALVQGHQLRQDTPEIGPSKELDYWRSCVTKYNKIAEFCKSKPFINYLQCLRMCRSKVIRNWDDMNSEVINLLNEAEDNVKFLSSIEKYWDPLYRSEPADITESLPALFEATKNVFHFSNFYTTSERIKGFLSKVTNQIIITSVKYLTEGSSKTIWQQEKETIIGKIDICKKLEESYKGNYRKVTKQMNENPEEKAWECSETFLFGRLNTFIRRLNKIREMLLIVLGYKILETTDVRGMKQFWDKINNTFLIVTQKSYDPLAHRMPDFDDDFSTFQKDIENIELSMQKFVKDTVAPCCTSDQRLLVLKRFEKLNLDSLGVDRRYLDTFDFLEKEIVIVKDSYNEDRHDPPCDWNLPPAVGRIMWVRMLLNKIDEPMQFLRSKTCVIEHKRAQICVKYYNSATTVLVHYEMQHHKAWYDYADQVTRKLEIPIIQKNPGTNYLQVNMDPYVFQVIKEAKSMMKLGLEIPPIVFQLVSHEDRILNYYNTTVELASRNNRLRKSIPPKFIPLMRPQLIELEKCFAPVKSDVTWLSTTIEQNFNLIKKTFQKIEEFLAMITDMDHSRITQNLLYIANAELVYLPTDDAVSADIFFEKNVAQRRNIEKKIADRAFIAENTVLELINKFVSNIEISEFDENGKRKFRLPPEEVTDENRRTEEVKPFDKYDWIVFGKILAPVTYPATDETMELCFKEYGDTRYDLAALHNDCMDLFAYYNNELIMSLVKCTKNAIEKLKERAEMRLQLSSLSILPLFQTSMELKIPEFILDPDVVSIEKQLQAVLKNITETNHAVSTWGRAAKTPQRIAAKVLLDEQRYDKTLQVTIKDHKDVSRHLQNFDEHILTKRTEIPNYLKELKKKFQYLWAENREEQIEEFVKANPLTADITDRFILYDSITAEISSMEKYVVFGSIKIFIGHAIDALVEESKAWKKILGRKLSDFYKEILDEIVDFITDHQKVLKRELKDLDDCRIAMKCLAEINENFITIDQNLMLIEDTYAMFNRFEISVPAEDTDRVENLRYMFNSMNNSATETSLNVGEMQEPLMKELIQGVKKFQTELNGFEKDFQAKGPMVPGLPAREASNRVLIFQCRFDDLSRRYDNLASAEQLFGMKVHEYEILQQRKKDFNYLNKLYSLYTQVIKSIDGYSELPWSHINMEKIHEEVQEFVNRCRMLPKGLKDWPAFIELKKKIENFYETCPLIEMMVDKSMKERHWESLGKLLDMEIDVESPSFTLGDILNAPLLKNKDDIEDVCVGATKEGDIESKLRQVIAEWSQIDLTFASFKNRGELLLKSSDVIDIVVMLEDSLMIMGSLASNRFNTPFKREVTLWLQKLTNTNEILEKWMQVQNLWIYLEAVFNGGDIAKQLPAETKRFGNIDRSWVRLMYRAKDTPNAVGICSDEITADNLNFLLEQLEACQKSLSGYLEAKRLIFPRFFFISDPVLLEILGQASDPTSIQNHLESLFDGVSRVEFDEDNRSEIKAMISNNGEKVPLKQRVICTGPVEIWLGKLLHTVRETVKDILTEMARSLTSPAFDFITGFQTFCAQAGLIGLQLLWTADAELALKKASKNKKLMMTTNRKFLELLNNLVDLTTKDLTKLQRISYETMITIHVHQCDIFEELVQKKVTSLRSFEWKKQARFYCSEDDDFVKVEITNVLFEYQNEYLGVTDRLAITPLTDRCYITLAQAINMNMGGAPAGPAGTGKTETVKDMGRALGKYVIVFNCSDQMDFRGLGRIFKGLAQSGSWGCFDEFNRIELPVLSVAAMQISIVLDARKQKLKEFIFSDGDKVSLNREFGIFITMNPGYAGRQELPENLKSKFRTVAMMVPDRQIIMRVKLASCGFRDNIVLARKFFTLYKLCEEQLSKQIHYDFGLRNILSCLRTLGAQKRAAPPKTKEDVILMRVLRDMNLSKLVDEDEPLFNSLIAGLFPGLQPPSSQYKELQNAITKATKELGLINADSWNLKVIQLYETSLVRHGLMVLGPTGSGKTKCMNTLLRAFTIQGKTHKEMRMNPKAITASEMFGRLDVTTNDWTDGIFSVLWRRSLKFKKDFVWLVLDGPIDAVWIENLNSVLDDNKTLTLANGDRIVMSPNCKLVFEPDNVDNASPATISRMGMVFMSSSVLQWTTIVEAWFKHRPEEQAKTFEGLFDKIYADLLLFVQTKLSAKMRILEANYIRQTCDLLNGLLEEHETVGVKLSEAHLERIFLFSLMWSLGALLELDDRDKMEKFVLSHSSKMKWPKPKIDETIFEYFVSGKGQWEHWNSRVEQYLYPEDSVPEYSSILVPNVDNVRTLYLTNTIAKQSKSVLLIGEQGTAKTVMIKGYLSQYDPEMHMSKSFNFSSATTPNMVQRIVESYVEKRVGNTYGPPQQRKMTVFIDDVSMPVINEWGDQTTNEIVRQLMETKGFYSLEKPGDFSTIADVQFLAAMIHPGGGRNDIPPRLKRQFNIFNCTLPGNVSIDKIFGVIGEGYFCPSRFNEEIVGFIPKLIPLTRILWQHTKLKMLPTPAKFHYIFNLRDLSRIWGGMLKIERDECVEISTLLKLWRHECTRVISDRFINKTDREWFSEKIADLAKAELGQDFQYFPQEESYFVDFLRDLPEPSQENEADELLTEYFVYEEIKSFEYTKERIMLLMDQYNREVRGGKLDLVLFEDALVHLMIISRIIRTSRGNALLVGVGGSGKQSLTKLASFIAGYKTYQITLTRSYNTNNLAEDFKHLYRLAGLGGKGITFIFTDNEIKEENFLEYFNNVLSSGEIANLFAKDEIDEITSEIAPIMRKEDSKRAPTSDNLYDFFITRARNNLHIVLCFSPVGEKFRNRALKFPGLISGCVIDWFLKWPMDALVEVSHHFLKNFDIQCTEEVKHELVEIMAYVQDNVAVVCDEYYEKFRRQVHVTPKSFLTFLDGYKNVYKMSRDHISGMSNRMTTGLQKLIQAEQQISVLKEETEKKRAEILLMEAEVSKVLVEVEETRKTAEEAKAEVFEKVENHTKLNAVITQEAELADEKYKLAEPALAEATQALKVVNHKDVAAVRRLARPPYLITVIMDAVSIFLRERVESVKPDLSSGFMQTSWKEALKILAGANFLNRVAKYETDLINGEMVDLLVPFFNYPDYTFEKGTSACGSVAGLLSWTKAMAKLYEVNQQIIPLKERLRKLNAKRSKAEKELEALENTLRIKKADLDMAERTAKEANNKVMQVKAEAQSNQNKLESALILLDLLADEKIGWTEQTKTFEAEIDRLVGDVVILTGFLSYIGPFNQDYRAKLQATWIENIRARGIPSSDNINIIERLVDNTTIGEWKLEGLPNDELSTQNGIIVTQASRYPLLIDPQSQGKAWIKNKEKDSGLIVTSLNHKYFRNQFEDAVLLGHPMLIEDVGEELDPCMDNVLEKNYIKIGTSYKVKVGDKEIDVHEHFRLYITTKISNPSFTPEIAARTAIIDFTVTLKGLEDQLLGRVILSERQEMESHRVNLIADVTANKRLKSNLETELLQKLSNSQGSLIEDPTVMQILQENKKKSKEIREKVEVTEVTVEGINKAREQFRPVATRGSVLYFLIVTMSQVNNMYQTSLVQFLERFDFSLENSEKSPVITKRIESIKNFLTHDIFKYKSRGLYETHKFLFVLLMALNIDLEKNDITFEEFQIFIKGGAALDIKTCPPNTSKWITDMTWLNLVQLSNLENFSNILEKVAKNEKAWKLWFEKNAPEEETIPSGYNNLNAFKKLLLIRSWCPDRTLLQSRKYLAKSLGPQYVDPVVLNFDEMLEESRALTPIICFLSMGTDPTSSIESLAKKNEIRLDSISMGQGQEVHARKLINKAVEKGRWVLLQNCHLSLSYMEEIIVQLSDLETKNDEVNENFRLWITTECHPSFPITLLQVSIKYTNEPPSGVKAGIVSTYQSMNMEILEHTDNKFYLPLIYSVSFLHTIVQERRKFGALGWNISYEFNRSDWFASCLFTQNHIDDADPKKPGDICWDTVHYMIGEVQYGGRVTDDYDKRLLNCFVKTWFSERNFDPDFEFYKGYKIISKRLAEETIEDLENLPLIDSPEVYRLHPNANITYQTNTVRDILDTIISVQPKESRGAGEETREDVVVRLVEDMLQRIPEPYNEFEVKEKLSKSISPMSIFLRQEIDRIQKIIKLVRSTLSNLLLAIEGTIIMNEQLRDAFDNIYDARVPEVWKRGSWLSSTLGFWFTELTERNRQFHSWCFKGRPPMFWMTGFFNPQGFLTAMRQEVASNNVGWALDQVVLHNEVTKMTAEECKKSPKVGVHVYGMFLDGAGWDRKNSKLIEAKNKILYTPMPVIHIYAINSTEPKDPTLYECPVYKKANRTGLNFITPLCLKTDRSPDHWILRGVALLCDIK